MYVVLMLMAVAPGGETSLGGVDLGAHEVRSPGERMKSTGVGEDEGS